MRNPGPHALEACGLIYHAELPTCSPPATLPPARTSPGLSRASAVTGMKMAGVSSEEPGGSWEVEKTLRMLVGRGSALGLSLLAIVPSFSEESHHVPNWDQY